MLIETIMNNSNNLKPESPHVAKHEGVVIDFNCSQAFLFGEDNMSKRFVRKGTPLCACRCGEKVVKSQLYPYNWNKFINGHGNRNKNFLNQFEKPPLCVCGCGGRVKWSPDNHQWNKYIKGHYKNDHFKTIKFRKKTSKRMLKNNPMNNPESRKKISKANSGKNHPFYNKKRPEHSEYMKEHSRWIGRHTWVHIISQKKRKESSQRMKENNPMYNPKTREKVSKHMKKHSFWIDRKLSKKERGQISKRMKNGGAAHALSFIKKISKPQMELFILIKQIFSSAILEYQSLNRLIDIAIPEKMIAIEYDGSYWHQDKEADDKRQRELEGIGWKFLRYCDYIPTTNELKKDLKNVI